MDKQEFIDPVAPQAGESRSRTGAAIEAIVEAVTAFMP
ncbi:nucleoid DNA-binding protein [Paraburkholderia sp. GAS32]